MAISGPGVGLPPPSALYPANLNNTPYDAPNNYMGLPGGGVVTIPNTGANGWIVDTGGVSILEWLDPVTGVWRLDQRPGGGMTVVSSDGFTRRIANMTGCPVSAIVAGGGTGFATATATVSSNIGGSTWLPIVGGALSVSAITAAGSGYSLPPILHIPIPPAPGVQASGHCVLTGTSVTGVTLDNVGAGYMSATVGCLILPNPIDPNAGMVSAAACTLILNAGLATAITAVLCTYNGAPLAAASIAALTLTAAGGAGTGATITPLVMQAIQSAVATAGGGGFGTATSPPAVITSGGGGNVSVSAIGNPAIEMTNFRPRQGVVGVTSSGTGGLSAPVVVDPGLFLSAPTAAIVPGGTLPTTLASITLTLGSVNDVVLLQPLL